MTKFSLKEVAPCLFAIFIDVLGFGLVAPLLVAIFTSPTHNLFDIASTSLRYFYLGLSLSLYPILMFFGTSFIGDLSDIIGRKKTLLLSMMGIAIGFLIMSIGVMTSSLFLFLLGRGISGLVSASQSVALAAISDLSTKENKAIHLSYVALIQCIGFVLGPLMGGVLSGTTFYTPFLVASLLALTAFLWIAFCFEETFKKLKNKTISIQRFLTVFVEAYHNKRVRHLSFAFFTMQVAVALYLPVILILFTTDFGYSPLYLGLFNGYLGVGFALGLLFLLPQLLKRYKIEQIVCLCLFVCLISQFFSSFLHSQVILWLLALPLAITLQTAFSGMFTSFSNAVDERSQGWVMGISVATMAIAWAVSGFSAQLIPLFGTHMLIFFGSLLMGISTYAMKKYCSHYARTT